MQSHGGTMRAFVISALVLISALLWWGIYQQSEFNRVREMWRECAASYKQLQAESLDKGGSFYDFDSTRDYRTHWASDRIAGVYAGGADDDSVFHLLRMTRDGRVLCECSK